VVYIAPVPTIVAGDVEWDGDKVVECFFSTRVS
jgi:hypothetical protein